MTAIHSIAGLNYQIDVTIYCILRSLIKSRFLSCKIEVDIELESDACKNMDLYLNLKEPTDSVHLFEIKDVHNLNESSKLEQVVNELFIVYRESITKIERIYLVHSAPSVDDLASLRDGERKVNIITSYRKKHFEKIINENQPKKPRKRKINAVARVDIDQQLKAEHDQIKRFAKNFHLVHLPNCKDRLLDNSDLKLRIEALIRQVLNKIFVNEPVDCRQIREAFSNYVNSKICEASQELKANSKYASKVQTKKEINLKINEIFDSHNSLYRTINIKDADDLKVKKQILRQELNIPFDQLDLPMEIKS